MDKREWLERFKGAMAMIQEPMTFELLKQDSEYQESAMEADQCEKCYQEIEGQFRENERKIVEGLLTARDKEDQDYSTLSFIAGVQSGYWLRELFDGGSKQQELQRKEEIERAFE